MAWRAAVDTSNKATDFWRDSKHNSLSQSTYQLCQSVQTFMSMQSPLPAVLSKNEPLLKVKSHLTSPCHLILHLHGTTGAGDGAGASHQALPSHLVCARHDRLNPPGPAAQREAVRHPAASAAAESHPHYVLSHPHPDRCQRSTC